MRIISGMYRNRQLISPKGDTTRPTSEKLRGSLFNICQNYIEDALFLDLFAGSGAMGLEALSRGAKSVTFVESDRDAIRCIKQNVASLDADKHASIIRGNVFDVLQQLQKQGKKYDIIYADPPYGAQTQHQGAPISYSAKVATFIDVTQLLKHNGMLFIEDSMNSYPDDLALTHLKLISSRNAGRSLLLQFEMA